MSLTFKKGRYKIDFYTNGRGTRVRMKLDADVTEEEARLIYADTLSQYKSRDKIAVTLGLTISQLTSRYLKWYELYRAKTTYRDARQVFEGHVERLLGSVVAENLLPKHILDYQRQRRQENVTNRTINKELFYLSGCLAWAAKAENGYISARTWKIGVLPHPRPIPQVLSVDEVRLIMDAAEPFYRAIFLCMYSLGLRMNEARMMRWKDIDRQNYTVTVFQKGGTFKRLPLNPALLDALDAIAGEKNSEKNSSGTDYIFLSKRSGKPVYDVRKAIARACKIAGIEKHVNPHLFRHSVATHLLGQNTNMRTIQSYLGHSNMQSTEWYTHVAKGHLDAASDVISAGLNGSLTTSSERRRGSAER